MLLRIAGIHIIAHLTRSFVDDYRTSAIRILDAVIVNFILYIAVAC